MSFWSSLLAIFKPAPKSGRIVAPAFSSVAFTGSMKPVFQGGETVFIEARPFDLIKTGDIIVVWWEGLGLNVLHEVIRIKVAADGEVYFITKGTANGWRDDHTCTEAEYVGFVQRPTSRPLAA